MSKACFRVLNHGMLIKSVNKTNVVLVPKKKNAMSMNDFGPINSCNVIYKIVMKTMANGLKIVLPNLISPHQSGLVDLLLIMSS